MKTKLTRYLIDSLAELEKLRSSVDELIENDDPKDEWMTVADHLDQEILWRRDMFHNVIRGN